MLIYYYVEGDGDDELFINRIIKPLFDDTTSFQIIPYIGDTGINSKLKTSYSLKSQGGTDVIYLRDSDFNNHPRSITDVKTEVLDTYRVEEEDIVIVVIEIESWYYAGLTPATCRELGIDIYPDLDLVTKEKLIECALRKGLTKKQLELEILDHYDLDFAIQQNDSFAYFINLLQQRFENLEIYT